MLLQAEALPAGHGEDDRTDDAAGPAGLRVGHGGAVRDAGAGGHRQPGPQDADHHHTAEHHRGQADVCCSV